MINHDPSIQKLQKKRRDLFVKVPVTVIDELFAHASGIGMQVNEMLAVFDWEPFIVSHLARVSGHLGEMRGLLRKSKK